ncbi:putative ribosomal protein l50 mitochondria protein [Lasiodiplodia theobromae]|uniref:Ribosomal protein l50 mitochondria protein n=1 Tax=Lasiodiplodia theobromae TaxID=45133 RepID=UPI0015C2D8A4|nr:Ribosomal protein l50 mitochondria protein [Lasiodiplodia theobromae]KAF4546688.1 Ribosomal protein l50 mitochondria protein [Lasiodiplodia theobromae]KAF9632096.1 putative ribosomal protein l50 mitochondria protein [Lasiodiplodia theobromae]
MRRIPRLSRPIDRALKTAAAPRRPLQQCRACAFSTTTPAREEKPFTERLRNKIWGTDYAPGREDPYSVTSPMRPAERPAAAPQQPSKKTKAAAVAAASSSEEAAAAPKRSEQSLEDFDPNYAPAKTWHGLEWVGGKEWQKEQEQLPSFKRFAIPSEKKTDANEIAAALRRALVEVYTARSENKPLKSIYSSSKKDKSVKVELTAAEDGSAIIKQKAADQQTSSIVEAVEEARAWKPISLRDPQIKFAVVKRVMQLTGIRITDPVITSSNTAGVLLSNITAPPPPQKLAEKLENNQTLSKLPNVKISSRRITPIDKEKQVGRWKVIEQKLLDKNLPVVGHEI